MLSLSLFLTFPPTHTYTINQTKSHMTMHKFPLLPLSHTHMYVHIHEHTQHTHIHTHTHTDTHAHKPTHPHPHTSFLTLFQHFSRIQVAALARFFHRFGPTIGGGTLSIHGLPAIRQLARQGGKLSPYAVHQFFGGHSTLQAGGNDVPLVLAAHITGGWLVNRDLLWQRSIAWLSIRWRVFVQRGHACRLLCSCRCSREESCGRCALTQYLFIRLQPWVCALCIHCCSQKL